MLIGLRHKYRTDIFVALCDGERAGYLIFLIAVRAKVVYETHGLMFLLAEIVAKKSR